MWSLMMLGGWAFAIAVFAIGIAVFAVGKLLFFMLELWSNDPDLHRKKDKDGE